MASIRQHRGKWQARYYDPSGRLRSRSFARKSDARAFLAAVETDKRRGEWTDPRLGRVTLGEYVETWAATKANVRARTRLNVEGRLRAHILPVFGPVALGAIQPADVRAWVAELSAKGLAPSTVKATYLTFGQIMRTAEIDGIIHRSPCIGVELPADSSRTEMHFLTPGQVAALASSVDDRYRCLIFTAAYTGMRAGELGALKLERVNLLKRTVDVVESLGEVRGVLTTGPTKTGKRRTVSLPSFLADMIGAHIGSYPGRDGYVFTAAQGGPIRQHNFRERHFKPATRRAGLPEGVRFHDLRHTCAAILIDQGSNPKQIQARLGHASIRTTLDRYGHLFDGHDAALLEGLDATYREAKVNLNVAQTWPKRGPVVPLRLTRDP
ncbi:MAG: site-specific integrase [Actinobacteria bacterium]|nr:site-specific integrase [Actinomycetota bacterium]MDQ3531400.1 site-specific integrase [Actinomycetota bacterium]